MSQKRQEEIEALLEKAYRKDGFQGLVGTAIGAASVCWESMEGTGVFQSDDASYIVDLIMARHNQECRLATAQPRTVDAHSAKSGLFDPTKEEGDPEK